MAEYIEREAAKNAVFDHWLDSSRTLEAVKSIPAADVVPVVHAQWIYRGEEKGYQCSACQSFCLLNYESDWCKSEYCPHCGAKMDGKENIILYTEEEIEKAKMIRFLFPSAYELCKYERKGIAICQKDMRIALIDDDSFFPSLPKGKSDTLENIIKGR